MADDRGGAWSSSSSLSADTRLRVDAFYSGQDVHRADSHTREAVERLSEYEAEARKAFEKVTQGVTEKVIPL